MGRNSLLSGRVAKVGKGGVHPKSRKANKIGKNLAHDKRVEQRHVERQSKKNSLSNKLTWFQSEIVSEEFGLHEKRAFTHADIKVIVDRYIEDLKEEAEEFQAQKISVPSKRIPNNSQLKKEAHISQTIEQELSELDTEGLEIPDLLAVENVLRLREWDGSAAKLPAIKLMRFRSADGQY